MVGLKGWLVRVDWTDALDNPSWQSNEELKSAQCVQAVHYGIFVEQDAERLLLTHGWHGDGQWGGSFAIPALNVVKITKIRKVVKDA